MAEKMRVSFRSSRRGSTAHNERDFDVARVRYIDSEKTADNFYFSWRSPEDYTLSGTEDNNLSDAEHEFYEMRYRKALDSQNDRHRKSRHIERIKNMEDWLSTNRYIPEEHLLQIGNKNHAEQIDDDVFIDCVLDYIKEMNDWSHDNGDHLNFLDVAVHVDEASPHAHLRRVWDHVDEHGLLKPGQEKALEQSGVELPYPDKKVGRYNNRKMTFDAMMRGKWQDIVEEHGFEIERTPRPGPQFHDNKYEYGRKQDKAREERWRELLEAEAKFNEQISEFGEAKAEFGKVVAAKTQELKSLEQKQDHEHRKRTEAIADQKIRLVAREEQLKKREVDLANKETHMDMAISQAQAAFTEAQKLSTNDQAEEYIKEIGHFNMFKTWLKNKFEKVKTTLSDAKQEAKKARREIDLSNIGSDEHGNPGPEIQ